MKSNSDLVLLIDKPSGYTSFDVVAIVRKYIRQATSNRKIKVGHAGTLDPMATGLLIVLTGKMTKQQDSFMKKDKTYEAEITLGAVSDTDDAEGNIVMSKVECRKAKTKNKKTLMSFVGESEQMPPQYSAIKVAGKKAYEVARKGGTTELKARKVRIYSIENVKINGNKLSFTTKVSSGTYIRSIARDLGQKLGCGGYLSKLRRIKIDEFDVNKAYPISEINLTLLEKMVATTE